MNRKFHCLLFSEHILNSLPHSSLVSVVFYLEVPLHFYFLTLLFCRSLTDCSRTVSVTLLSSCLFGCTRLLPHRLSCPSTSESVIQSLPSLTTPLDLSPPHLNISQRATTLKVSPSSRSCQREKKRSALCLSSNIEL